MMEKEIRYLNEDIILRTEDEKRIVEGYALVFDKLSHNLGWFREKIDRKALDNADMSDVVALFNHNDNYILARTASKTLELEIDKKGLKYRFEAPNTTAGNDLIESLKRGDVRQSSFGFSISKDAWEEDDENGEIRTILEIKRLWDVSPVVHPAYPQTSVAKRSYDDFKKDNGEPINNININIRKRKLQILKRK